jgi:hypothetical protein
MNVWQELNAWRWRPMPSHRPDKRSPSRWSGLFKSVLWHVFAWLPVNQHCVAQSTCKAWSRALGAALGETGWRRSECKVAMDFGMYRKPHDLDWSRFHAELSSFFVRMVDNRPGSDHLVFVAGRRDGLMTQVQLRRENDAGLHRMDEDKDELDLFLSGAFQDDTLPDILPRVAMFCMDPFSMQGLNTNEEPQETFIRLEAFLPSSQHNETETPVPGGRRGPFATGPSSHRDQSECDGPSFDDAFTSQFKEMVNRAERVGTNRSEDRRKRLLTHRARISIATESPQLQRRGFRADTYTDILDVSMLTLAYHWVQAYDAYYNDQKKDGARDEDHIPEMNDPDDVTNEGDDAENEHDEDNERWYNATVPMRILTFLLNLLRGPRLPTFNVR